MAEKRRSPCALSVKAHAFSVEALIGAEKRRRTADREEGNDGSERSRSPELSTDRLNVSERSNEADCASVGSRKSSKLSSLCLI